MKIKLKPKTSVLAQARTKWERGEPTGLSDDEYDSLNTVDPEYIGPGGTVPHTHPMLSLQKSRDPQQIASWAQSRQVCISPKVDGAACSLRYRDGLLVAAVTRGDGSAGENIPLEFVVKAVPSRVDPNIVEVRGEFYVSTAEFAVVQQQGEYSSPRNLAAGLLHRKELCDDHEVLQFYPYSCHFADPSVESDSHVEHMTSLHRAGFKFGYESTHLPKVGLLDVSTADSRLVTQWKEWVGRFPADTDGVVFRLVSYKEYTSAGKTRHHPRGAMAFKFSDEVKTTRIVDIEWSVSRSRTVTPVAVFEPTTLAGATITRATLHNYTTFKTLSLSPGSFVEITRRGGIIPHVERVVAGPEDRSALPFNSPTECPGCGSKLSEKGETLVCESPICGDALHGCIIHFFKTLKVKGLGDALCQEVLESNTWVLFPTDVFHVDWPEGALATKVKEQVDNLHKSKILGTTILVAMGVDSIGEAVSERILQKYSLRQLLFDNVDLTVVPSVKSQLACKIQVAIQALPKEYRESIFASFAVIDTVGADRVKKVIGPLSGKTVLVTGALSFPREHVHAQIERLGGRSVSSASRTLTYLIDAGVGEPSSKRKAVDALIAKGAKIQILSKLEGERLLGL